MIGLFAHQTRSHRGPGRQAIAARGAERRQMLDHFAECLAEGGTVAKCGAAARQDRRLGRAGAEGDQAR